MKEFITGLSGCRERRLGAGEFLFRQDDRAAHIYYVREGRIKLVRSTIEGSDVTMSVAKADQTLAEGAITSERYHCNAVAETDSLVLCIPKPGLLAILGQEPRAAMEFIVILSAQLRKLRTLFEIRNVRSARERVFQYLLLEADPDTGTLDINRPLKEIASEIGLAHETLYRTLAQLEKEGVISRKESVIIIRE